MTRTTNDRGATRYLRSNNSPEFVSRALLQWIMEQGIETTLIDLGKPWQNGTAESSNGKLRDECLNREGFCNRTEARIVIEDCRQHYNTLRLHSSLEYLTPQQAAQVAAEGLPIEAIPNPGSVKNPSRSVNRLLLWSGFLFESKFVAGFPPISYIDPSS